MVNNFQLLIDVACSESFPGRNLTTVRCSKLDIFEKGALPVKRTVSFRTKDNHPSAEKWYTVVNMRPLHNGGNRMLLARTQRVAARIYRII